MATPIEAGELALKVLGGHGSPEHQEKAKSLLSKSLEALLSELGDKPSKKSK